QTRQAIARRSMAPERFFFIGSLSGNFIARREGLGTTVAHSSITMERTPPTDPPRRVSFVTLALITAALYFGRDVLIPLALAILISFILTPSVHPLQQQRLGRGAARAAAGGG